MADYDRYKDQEAAIGRDKTLSLVGMVAGAALIGVGIYLLPKDRAGGSSGVSARLVPSGNGAALVGVFP
ncbi:MAG: hypothetical protein ACT4TC_07400 [Myxococcaceae bacterium]